MNPPTSSLPRLHLAPVLLPVVVALTAVLAGCSRPAPAPEPVRAVRTLTISADSAGGSHDYAAEVRARTESRLAFRVGGKMVARPAEVGQRVRAGQVLAQLDPQDLRLAQTAAAAALQAAQVNMELAEADFQRYQGLRAQGFISAAELDRRASTLKAAKAQFAQAQAQAGVQGNQAAYSALTATVAGVVTAVEAEPGAVLAAGTPVVRLAHDGPRDVVFAVPEDVVARMRPLLGQPGALKVRLWGQQAMLPATLREVAAAADPATRTFQVKADLGGAEAQLGQTATVVIDLPRQEGVTRLPLTAVMQQQGRTAVWRLDTASMTVQVQPVQVAGADGNTVIVTAGLQPGQVVVTAGVHVLTPGQKVKLYQATTPPAAAASSASAAAR
ncbi:efflux RND transporter periplasmic adaptor subunit [Rubrivivax sp. RP6-9]|uniref:efflux RND transporter periplasmic adaptor subunit n=1 Tax=Rubrivivax sp. RP6-9 TaxID=3415750 RepID=UPI003CC6A96C